MLTNTLKAALRNHISLLPASMHMNMIDVGIGTRGTCDRDSCVLVLHFMLVLFVFSSEVAVETTCLLSLTPTPSRILGLLCKEALCL